MHQSLSSGRTRTVASFCRTSVGSPNLRDPFAGLPAWLVPCDEHPRGQLLKGALGHVVPFVLIVIALFFATGADGIADLIF